MPTPDLTWAYRTLIRPLLFAQDAETIHERTMRALEWVARREVVSEALASVCRPPALPLRLFGLSFPNPVGLAAGMDKAAAAVPAWAALGFGFSELGAVTWHAQPGNPPPRVFRVVTERAIINRMGFNNPGAAAFARRLAEWRAAGRWPAHPVGVNLGKSKLTPLDRAAEDYVASFRALRSWADFFVVNVSSPNTPHLRQLQDREALDTILTALQQANTEGNHPPASPAAAPNSQAPAAAAGPAPGSKPILVKVAPDLSFNALDQILELVGPRRIAGLVATNTTITRPEATTPALARLYAEGGGLSGQPLRTRSTEVIRHLHRQTGGRLPLIGVGGIFDAQDAWEKIAAGANLVQVYTGLVFEGPGLVRSIVTGLRARLAAAGLTDLTQAVGCEAATDDRRPPLTTK